MSCFWGCKSVRYFECIQTQSWLKWIAEVSSLGIALWFLARKVYICIRFSLNKFGSISLLPSWRCSAVRSQCCDGLHLRSDDAITTWGIILYVSHKGMYRPKGYGFCAVLVWKWVYTLPMHFGLESGMVFEETTGVYERIYRFNSKCMRKKEK